jgi:hypothetical protein
VADPGCLSRILIFTHPRSRIPDPKTATKERGENKFDVIPFYVATNFTKLYLVHYFSFEVLKKKIWANFQRIIELFAQKIVTKLSKVCVWDPGSRIQGSKRHRISDPGSRSATLIKIHHIDGDKSIKSLKIL